MVSRSENKLIFILLFIWTVESASKFCRSSSDCGGGKQCCGRVCLMRTTCDGSCVLNEDCDLNYGETCVSQKCACITSTCLEAEATTKSLCQYDFQCSKNETCKDGLCEVLNETHTQPLDTTVLAIVATVGLIIFAGSFYLCLRHQKSSRPSLAAKEAHRRAKERLATANNINPQSVGATSEKSDSSERCANGKRHSELKSKNSSHRKPPLSTPCSTVELSAIIEEDEISEIVSK